MTTATREDDQITDRQTPARMDARVLVLNAGYEPVMTVSIQRALCLVIDSKAEIVEADELQVVRSPSLQFLAPLVIRLLRYIRVPRRVAGRIGRRLVFARDGYRCAYCRSTAQLTIDHIVPRSRGGDNSWENVVTSCRPCNQRKGDRPLEETGMRLLVKPRRPTALEVLCRGTQRVPEAWQTYLAYAA